MSDLDWYFASLEVYLVCQFTDDSCPKSEFIFVKYSKPWLEDVLQKLWIMNIEKHLRVN